MLFVRILGGVLSAGWLLPLSVAGYQLLQYLERDLPRSLLKGGGALDESVVLGQVTTLFFIAVVWLALVVVGWTVMASRRRRSGTAFADWTRRLGEKEAQLDTKLTELQSHLDVHRHNLDHQVQAVGEGSDRLAGSVAHRLALLDAQFGAFEEKLMARLHQLGDQVGTAARTTHQQRVAEHESLERLMVALTDQQTDRWASLQGLLRSLPQELSRAQEPDGSAEASRQALEDGLRERLSHMEELLAKVHAASLLSASELREVRVAASSVNASWFGELPAGSDAAHADTARLRSVVLNLSVLEQKLREQEREMRKRAKALDAQEQALGVVQNPRRAA